MFQKFKSLSRLKKVGIVTGTLVLLGIAGSANQPKTANLSVQGSSNHGVLGTQTDENSQQTKQPVITTKTITETQSIPFASTSVNDSSLPKGQSKVTVQGVNGTKTLTYKVTYTDGTQTAKDLLSEVVTLVPINQVTAIGTYVAASLNCPNGTYVNSAGNTVCSPYSSPSAPAGATAQCVDGTYSFSQSHSGTCSHHGGVATWL